MGYQLYKRVYNFGRKLHPTGVSITQTSFGLGPDISKDLSGQGNVVEIYIDKENKKIGFKAGKNSSKGYLIQHMTSTTNIVYVRAKNLAAELPNGRYAATKEGDMWVIKVPDMNPKII